MKDIIEGSEPLIGEKRVSQILKDVGVFYICEEEKGKETEKIND